MSNVLIINGHEYYSFSEGKLNASLVDVARDTLTAMGHQVQVSTMREEYDPGAEVDKHVWADSVIVQSPVNWMGVPWSCKKYMDLVYTTGLDGRLCTGDGRTRSDASKQYGTGGVLQGRKYMFSLTFNAPREAFDDAGQYLFQGWGVDDLFWPMHMNFRFFGMTPIDTFVCYDVVKNPRIEEDFSRYKTHLEQHFA
ncbi:NAD(P)H-dependent oxidoreductase [Desulfovibrio subterraneus]|uniref:NAD(P)H-dependent oxidoreductase n=1 Tax=Desulfovibrio subterraneus TaxID=2718620 RepID=UPI0022B8D9EB|nr:NAD(P)H-dependent oxidoreductase [Desulfovibrio subterraneus]WBF66917.1 NAD(P)H-dependent oxidoreductase [Desulfovibrio subterraneus]